MTLWQGAPWTPRRMQAEALPRVMAWLKAGKRPIVRACTGSGKSILTAELAYTAASRGRTVVVLVPTESLVEQTAATLALRCSRVARWYGRVHEQASVTVCCYPSLQSLLDDLAARKRTVDLLIADECHGTEAEKRQQSMLDAAPTWQVGVTATPYRADEAESLTLWDGICYEYTTADGVADGVLVPIVVMEAEGAKGTLVDDELHRMYQTLPTRPDTGRVRPGVVSAVSVEDADAYAAKLVADGWRAESVHYRRPGSEVADAVERLRVGELDMLVHIAMLSEGVDMPWLWWMALRRPLASRVQAVQTVGRVVRVDKADPAKTLGYVLDPHQVCSTVRLVHDAAVGVGGVLAEEAGPKEGEGKLERGEGVPMLLDGRTIRVRASEAERLWRQLAVSLSMAGLVSDEMSRGKWTTRPATDKQRSALGNMRKFTRHLPEPYREPWRKLVEHRDLSAGCASDLLSIIIAAADGGKEARQMRRAWTLDLTIKEGGEE